jgi:hypothetical protein
LPAKNLAELIAWLNANPDKATQGTAGAGGASDVAGIFFQREKRLERDSSSSSIAVPGLMT